jgi:hypothetical protein
MQIISETEVDRHPSYDPKGYVFRWRDGVYRAIYPAYESEVRQLWDCGLIPALVDAGLMPPSEITDLKTEDCGLIIKHATVPVVSLPSEWSFTMLQDAALTMLRVNEVARKYGYQTLDAHGFNILFNGSIPKFIDLGSLTKLRNDFNCKNSGWRPYGEFMRSFFAPLKLWSNNYEYIARRALMGEQLPMLEYWRIRHHALRYLPTRPLRTVEELYYRYKGVNTLALEEFRRHVSVSAARERWGERIILIADRGWLAFSSLNLERLERRVARLKRPQAVSKWADYHTNRTLDHRFSYIIGVIDKYHPRTVLDMAGNAGFLTRSIIDKTNVDYAICADYDLNAIDALYRSLERKESRLYPVVLNFSISVADSKFPPSHERFRSDMVIALAVTHHLILAQGLTLEFVLRRLSLYSNQFVLVEFMPMGLYSSEFDHVPKVPEWYNIKWFRAGMEKHFVVLDERELDKNRILFVAEKRSTSAELKRG